MKAPRLRCCCFAQVCVYVFSQSFLHFLVFVFSAVVVVVVLSPGVHMYVWFSHCILLNRKEHRVWFAIAERKQRLLHFLIFFLFCFSQSFLHFFVLFAGARKDVTNSRGKTPLTVAIEENKTATADAIRNFADAGVQQKKNLCCYFVCVVFSSTETERKMKGGGKRWQINKHLRFVFP